MLPITQRSCASATRRRENDPAESERAADVPYPDPLTDDQPRKDHAQERLEADEDPGSARTDGVDCAVPPDMGNRADQRLIE